MATNQDFFKAIGYISVLFATLDYIASTVILRLVGRVSGQETPYDDRATLGQKLILLENLTTDGVTHPDVLESIQKELPRARAAADERNRYIHDQWIFAPELVLQGRIRRIRLVMNSENQEEELTLEDLKLFANEIGYLQRIFAAALHRMDPNSFANSGV